MKKSKSPRKSLSMKAPKRKVASKQKTPSKQKLTMKKDQSERPKSQAALGEKQHHDIVQMLIDDHKPLKRLIGTMKDSEMSMSARRSAFGEFVPLLTLHAKAEENTLYTFEKSETEMREDAFEGFVEHSMAEQLVEEIKRTSDKDLWGARVKVLAELVEHHIEEEETEMFPEFKKQSDIEERVLLGEKYLAEKDKLKEDVLHPQVRAEEVSFAARI